MIITGTFLDEISHDIPHQNWGVKEWEKDFQYMQSIGIDTVVLIRGGYGRFITYPSKILQEKYGCYHPPVDLVKQFLQLSDQYGMKFYFGLYDSGLYWKTGDMSNEIDANRFVIEEVYKQYGHYKSFGGWYLSMEISRKTRGAIEAFSSLGQQCKEVSGGLPIFISPWIDGKKAVMAHAAELSKEASISLKQHEREWNEIFDGIHNHIDAVAFQDGHIDYHQLKDFFEVNKALAGKYNLDCWTNVETFDRDMPMKFLPIKFEKMLIKLEAARAAGYDKAITFEFSHFMSPQSAYLQAGHLFKRYKEYLKTLS